MIIMSINACSTVGAPRFKRHYLEILDSMEDAKRNQRKRSILYLRLQDQMDKEERERTDDFKELGKAIDTLDNKIDDLHRTFEELFTKVGGLYEQRDELCKKLDSQEGDEFQIRGEVAVLDEQIGALEEQMCSCKREIELSIQQIGIGIETETVIDHFRTMSDGSMPPTKKTKLGLV